MMNKIVIASLFGMTAVAVGAFGAHALNDILVENGRLETFHTAEYYQFYHTFALFICIALEPRVQSVWLQRAFYLFVAGILLFSGSLYVLALTNIKVLGAITPLGGLCFLSGWGLLAWSAKSLHSRV